MSASKPFEDIDGPVPLAELPIRIWLTADDVADTSMSSAPFTSLIDVPTLGVLSIGEVRVLFVRVWV